MQSFQSNTFYSHQETTCQLPTTFVCRLANDINTLLRNQDVPDVDSSMVHLVEDLFGDVSFPELASLNLLCDRFSCNPLDSFAWSVTKPFQETCVFHSYYQF